MELEYQKKIEILLEDIICVEARLIGLKNTKLHADEEYERQKADLEKTIKNHQRDLAILKQRGCAWQPADIDNWFEEEIEKEYKRWKNLTPEEKMKEHKERIGMLRKAEKNALSDFVPSQKKMAEDFEPTITDIQVDKWIEEENEKEIELLEKLSPEERPKNEIERFRLLQEAEKNN